ncbi:SDR family oxidoreductase [Geodermatophilus sp. URMC 64]
MHPGWEPIPSAPSGAPGGSGAAHGPPLDAWQTVTDAAQDPHPAGTAGLPWSPASAAPAGTAEEVAEVVAFLASDRAGLVTGSPCHADGG